MTFLAGRFAALCLSFVMLSLGAATISAQGRNVPKIVPIIGHSDWVMAVAPIPGGANIVSVSWDGTVKLWELQEPRRLLRTISPERGRVNCVVPLQGGNEVAVGNQDGTVQIWDLGDENAVPRTIAAYTGPATEREVIALALSSDASHLVSGGRDGTIKLWDLRTLELIRAFPRQAKQGARKVVLSVAIAPDAKSIAAGGEDGAVWLWDAKTGAVIRKFDHPQAVRVVKFSPDGGVLLTGSADGKVRLWNVGSGKTETVFDHGKNIEAALFWRGVATVLVAAEHEIGLWDVATQTKVRAFVGPRRNVASIAAIPESTLFLAGYADGAVMRWDTETGQPLPGFESAAQLVSSIAVAPDGMHIAAGSRDATVRLWNRADGTFVRNFIGHKDAVRSVAFSPDGRMLASGGEDNEIRLWNAVDYSPIRTIAGHADTVRAIRFTPDGKFVLSGSMDNTAALWNADTAAMERKFVGHARGVTSVAISSDGRRLLSGGLDKTIRLWNFETAASLLTIATPGQVLGVAFTADGANVLAAGVSNQIGMWNAATGELVRMFPAHSEVVTSLAVSPNGKLLLSGGWDSVLRLWDIDSGKLKRAFIGHLGRITSVAFSPDASVAMSGSGDGTIKVWDIDKVEQRVTLIGQTSKPDRQEPEWLSITPAGFFAGSRKGAEILSVVRQSRALSVMQFYDQLYRPDLVKENARGDFLGKHEDAASQLNLGKILDTGPAPQIDDLPGRRGDWLNETTLKVAVRLVNTGGGIGDKIVWRVNGVAQGEASASDTTAKDARVVTQVLRIDRQRKEGNEITVTAYNAKGWLATLPHTITVNALGNVSSEPLPRLHVLAVGVSKYAHSDWRLLHAAEDARRIGQLLESASKGLYRPANVMLALDEDATVRGIGALVDRIKTEAQPSDVFVLFVAGHGRSIKGTYYFLPQDLTLEGGRTVATHGIGQPTWEAWLKAIPAQKSILILDTCESAAAARGLDIERDSAMERLRHATGRSVITAATSAAFEGYEGFGLLTYAIVDAFRKKEGTSGAKEIDLYRLARHVETMVPIISERFFGEAQRPHNKIEGNFPVGLRVDLPMFSSADAFIPKRPTHVLNRPERVRERAAADAPGERTLPHGAQVRLVGTDGTWAAIARDGQKLGYVPIEALWMLQ